MNDVQVSPGITKQTGTDGLSIAVTGILIAALTTFGVFILPFFFPPAHPSLSASYSAGFNNRVAVVAAACVSFLSGFLAWCFRLYPCAQPIQDRRRIPLWILGTSIGACATFTAGFGYLHTKAYLASIDSRYFFEHMDDVVRYHHRIYIDFSFNYGPILLYFPLAIHWILKPFHIGIEGSYYTALTIVECLGLVLLYFTLESLPLSRQIKIVIYCLLAIGAISPRLALNYNLVRSLLPFSTLLFVARVQRPFTLAAAFFGAEILQLTVSPELGVAFLAGASFYALFLTFRDGPVWMSAIISPFIGAVVFLAIAGKAYLDSLAIFSQGGFNLVIEPLGYILLFLVSTIWLVPLMLAEKFRRRSAEAVLMASLFVVCLGLLPPALGRCDLLHVLYASVGMYLLASVAISSYPKNVRNVWFCCVGCTLVWTQIVNFVILPGIENSPTIIHASEKKADSLNVAKLETFIGNQKVSVPFFVSLRVEDQLKDSGHFLPDRECFDLGVWDARSEDARVTRMNQSEWALIPLADPKLTETPQNSSGLLGLGYNFYPIRRQPYVFGQIILDDLAAHWTPVATFNGLRLYRKIN